VKIFLSHRSRDKALVREFRELLPGFLNAWIDEDSLCWGDIVPAELRTTIQTGVDFLVIFLDNEALKSKWVVQELAWALQREKGLKRTFVLPVLLEEVAHGALPDGLSDRLFLRLADFSHASVESLAKSAVLKIFQLVLASYSSLQLEIPGHESLISTRDSLTAGQAKLLGFLVEQGRKGEEISQRRIEQSLGHPLASAELYYRLEALIQQRFVAKRRIATDGQFSYRLTEEFLAELA
jgi:TIR domain-containing protein